MNINDSAFPGPALIPVAAVVPGQVVRQGDDYLILSADNTWYNLTAASNTPAPTGSVQPVGASLVITAPA